MTEIHLIRGPRAENGTSMEVYGDSVRDGLRRAAPPGWTITERRAPEPTSTTPNALRWNRFVSFPASLQAGEGLFHILDHAHAHVMRNLPRARTVVTVHDLMPLVKWRRRIGHTRGTPPLLNMFSFSYLRQAAAIVADTESTKTDLVELLGCDARRITVIAPGIDSCFRPYSDDEKAAARSRLQLAGNPARVLLTGKQFYKNHDVSWRVVAQLANTGRPIEVLWLTGDRDQADRTASEHGISVRVYDQLDRRAVVDVFNVADVVLFPSLYEGFGWPPLEAMACGTPAVVSTTRALLETSGDAALSADPPDWQQFAILVARVLDDPDLRGDLRARGFRQAARYRWDDTAAGLVQLYGQLC